MIRLYGGHRNQAFRTNGLVKIIWKDGFQRQDQVRDGVLLENFVATHTDICARLLVDKSKPILAENGELVTYFRFAEGEIRYPWNLEEIASAAKLLGKFHALFEKVPPFRRERWDLKRLHLDFARGNVLFKSGESEAVGIIDFETSSTGEVEQDLGRTLSFILVDTPHSSSSFSLLPSSRSGPSGLSPRDERLSPSGSKTFILRLETLLTNYPGTFRKNLALTWALRYLQDEDYGDLNHVREKAVVWLNQIISNSG